LKNSLTTNATWNILARIAALAINFIVTPILISRLGTDHYGLYMLIMSVSGLMGLMSLGLGDATIRYVAYYGSRSDISGVNRVFRATFSVYLASGIFTVIVVMLASPIIISFFSISPAEKDVAILLLKLSGISFLFSLVGGVFGAIPQAYQRYDVSTKITVTVTLIQATITIYFVLHGCGIVCLVYIGIAATLLTLILNLRAAKCIEPKLEFSPVPSVKGLKEVFGYGIYSFLSQIFGMAFSSSDRLLIGIFTGSTAVGFFTVPQDLALRALSLIAQGGSVLFPKFSTIVGLKEQVRLYLNATWSMLFMSIIIFVPLTIFISDFISLWVSKEFAVKCSVVGQLIAFSSIIRGAFVTYEALFKGLNRPQYVTALSFVVGITSLGLNSILIPRYGIVGAGYSYCVTALWGVATLLITWKYVLKCSNYMPLARIVLFPVPIALTCMGLGYQLKLLIPPQNWFILGTEVVTIDVVTAFMLICFEKLLGKKNNCAETLLNGMRNAFLVKFQKI